MNKIDNEFAAEMAQEVFRQTRDFVKSRHGEDVAAFLTIWGSFMVGLNTVVFNGMKPDDSEDTNEAVMEGFEALVRDMRRNLRRSLNGSTYQ